MKAAIVLTLALLPTAALASQSIAGRVLIAAPKSSARLSGLSERLDGLWAGLALDVAAGRFTVSTAGTRGRVTSDAGSAPDRDVGEVVVSGRYEARNGLGFELRYAGRVFSSPAGYQRWDIVGLGASVSRDLGTPSVHAVATLAYLPIVNVTSQPRATFAISSDVGVAIAPRRSPMALRVSYRVERFSFFKLGRSEQFEVLTLSVGLRVRRADGRWTVGGAGP